MSLKIIHSPGLWIYFVLCLSLVREASTYHFTLTTNTTLTFSPGELSIEVDELASFNCYLSKNVTKPVTITFIEEGSHANVVALPFRNFTFCPGEATSFTVNFSTVHAGHVDVSANASEKYIFISKAYISIRVYESAILDIVSQVIGWIYFFFWAISFYPQIYENFRRKSVIGLNFDYLLLNFLGHMSYNFFNIGLFWIPSVQSEYFKEYPHGVNPVQPNDVAFSIHAVMATFLTIVQAFIYEKGDQKLSLTCKCLVGVFLTFLSISLILSITEVITWLDYLYYFSYVKLVITLLKCCPQAYLNYKRKSTVGWSIGNVLMDFIGGFLSILQMFLIAYNFNDWSSVFGDPTKFGLGLFSILFDIVFIIQHYCLYRDNIDEILDEVNSQSKDCEKEGGIVNKSYEE